jgi:hypothetical protein
MSETIPNRIEEDGGRKEVIEDKDDGGRKEVRSKLTQIRVASGYTCQTNYESVLLWTKVGAYDRMQCYGNPLNKEVEMVYCGEIWQKHSYNVIEVETTRVHTYRTFKNYKEYERYCEDKLSMRKSYNEIKERERNIYSKRVPVGADSVTALKSSMKNWNIMARDFVDKWGVDNVPEAMRYAIDIMLEEDTCGYRWLRWPALVRSWSGLLEGSKLHWTGWDLGHWAGVTEEFSIWESECPGNSNGL